VIFLNLYGNIYFVILHLFFHHLFKFYGNIYFMAKLYFKIVLLAGLQMEVFIGIV